MIISLINCVALLYVFAASTNKSRLDMLIRLGLLSLAVYNGFEAYRFYIMGA